MKNHALLIHNRAAPAAAEHYAALGMKPFPVQFRSKHPGIILGNAWQKQALDTPRMLSMIDVPCNVGVLLGTASNGLADVDLDCFEAIALAPYVLPSTWVFGRPGFPASHHVYTAHGAGSHAFTYLGQTLVELRADPEPGRPGHQTIFPPSVHADTGECIAWTADCDGQEAPRSMDAADLLAAVRLLACACLIAKCAGMHAAVAWLEHDTLPLALCPPDCPHDKQENWANCPGLVLRDWLGVGNVFAPPPPKRVYSDAAHADLARAVEEYNRAASRDYGRNNTQCPMCGSPSSFKALPGGSGRWVCQSTRHDTVGVKGSGCWTGDALDIDVHNAAGLQARTHQARRVELLKRDGFLKGGAA